MSEGYTAPIHESIDMLPGEPPVIVSKTKWVHKSSSLKYHREVELQFIRQGQGSYFIQDRNYVFKKNSLIMIWPYEVHCLVSHLDLWIDKWLVLLPETLLNEEGLKDFPRHICLAERDAVDLEVILKSIDDEGKDRRPFWQDIVKADLKKLTCFLRRCNVQAADELPEPGNQLIKEIVEYIEANFAQDLTLKALSNKFSLSPTYLSYLFKKNIGLNFKRYLIQRRIIEAKQLLENDPLLKIASIPEIVGFRDFPIFYRNFKLIAGLTPSAYRKIMYRHDK